ncbi:MAG TPA: aminotransferase class I/II-fold pyridoxal phosphate-dependent enzyme [Xanthomonadaceae bacterium]|nr:aminotransferase class I/II-fold pyridoxal phosphate-dependent enzyme [Xanthomonadaceae bacterium]
MSDDLYWILNHLGENRERHAGAVAPPVYQSSMFAYPDVASLRVVLKDELEHPFYTRGHNPTVDILRRKLAALEGAEDALVFGSGSGAMAAAVIALVSAGDHVVCVDKPYSWTRALLRDLLPRFAVETTFVDAREPAAVEAALTGRTRLIVLESPNSWTFEQQDLAAVAALAKARGLTTICDNSYATPLYQQPIAHGIDLVVHTLTKYLNGHSDVVGGCVCGTSALIRRIFRGPYMTLGAIMSPHDASLAIRGLRTLPIRLERAATTAAAVADWLRRHPGIDRVYLPGSEDDPQRALSSRQLKRHSGLLSVEIGGGPEAAERFCNALQRFLLTCSWGGHESLAWPVCALFDSENYARARTTLPLNLVRLSIGLEPAEILIADLQQALAKARA